MRIECEIGYWDDGFLTFNPDKIRELLFEHFPEAIFDKTNHSRLHIERFLERCKQKNLEPPDFVVDARWKIAFLNGPVYIYEIPFEEARNVVVTLRRFRITFEADFDFDEATELKIIEFLKLLEYGTLLSSRQTKNFTETVENRNYWKLRNE